MRKTIIVIALFVAIGCGKQMTFSDSVPAGGKITANGKPLNDVRVMFVPIDSMAPASGAAQHGSFTLQTVDEKKGALPGKYRVVIQADPKKPAGIRGVPVKYTLDNSPLEVTVPASGKTDFDIRLN